MVSQCTKFEVSRFTRYDAMNGGAICKNGVVWGQLGALKVVGNATIRYSAYDALLVLCFFPLNIFIHSFICVYLLPFSR